MAKALYLSKKDYHLFLKDAYTGGERWANPTSLRYGSQQLYRTYYNPETQQNDDMALGNVRSYLIPHEGETTRQFQSRRNQAQYINFCKNIVDAYTDTILSQVSRDMGSLEPFVSKVFSGKSWSAMMDTIAKMAAIHGYVFAILDTANAKTDSVISLEDAVASGVRAKVSIVEPQQIAWIEIDEDTSEIEEFAFFESVEYLEELSPYCEDMVLKVYSAETGTIKILRGKIDFGNPHIGSQINAMTVANTVALSPQWDGLPIIPVFFTQDNSSQFPFGYSLIADCADAAKNIYNLSSYTQEIYSKAAFPFLAYPTDPQGVSEQATRKIGLQNAFPYGSNAGVPTWVQPDSTSTQEMREAIKFIYNSALKSVGLELSAFDGNSDATSGTALSMRSLPFEDRARNFAKTLKNAEIEIAGRFAKAFTLDNTFVANYPTRFLLPDVAQDLKNVLDLLGQTNVELGTKAKSMLVSRALNKVLGADEKQLSEIMEEINGILERDRTFVDAKMTTEMGKLQPSVSFSVGTPSPPQPDTVVEAEDPTESPTEEAATD